MAYLYDTKRQKVVRVATPTVKGRLVQTKEMQEYLESLRKRYAGVDWDKELNRKIKLKPAKL